MDTLQFFKFQATGNDFVMIDDRAQQFDTHNHALIARLCHRRFGIGADGLILIREHSEADFEMIYFNADGRLTSLCGNGSRCAVQFARMLGMVESKALFMTVEGLLEAEVEQDVVRLHMPSVRAVVSGQGSFFVHTGSPHHVQYVDDIHAFDVVGTGRAIRHQPQYAPGGVNVNFIKELAENEIFVRTYERGVEDETLSCGTGVTAAAIVYGHQHNTSEVLVMTPGGELHVQFEKLAEGIFEQVHLKGAAKMVFSGQFAVGL